MTHRAWFCPVALLTYPDEKACIFSGEKHTDVTGVLWLLFVGMAA